MSKIKSIGKFKGEQINKNASATVDELDELVSKWATKNPGEFHTPEGLDALKQAVGDVMDTTKYGTGAYAAAKSMYDAVKKQITKQAPVYSKVMKEYSDASELIREIEKSLSLGKKTSADTAVRKLQSLLRNNVQTNYGNRVALARALESAGAEDLFPSLAGQSMNSWTPRGMVGSIEKVGLLGAPLLGAPEALAAAPLASPRIVGEVLNALGGVSGKSSTALNAALSGVKTPAMIEAEKEILRSIPLLAISANQ